MLWTARRLAVLLAVISTSGIAPAAQALVEQATPSCCGDDEHELPAQGEGCPPTCFACTRAMSPAPPVVHVFQPTPLARPLSATPRDIDRMPSDPPRRGVFHPPRSSR